MAGAHYLMIIGSAGHGNGYSKNKSKDGYLDTLADIIDAEKWFQEGPLHCKVVGMYHVKGVVGSAAACQRDLESFFKLCQRDKASPVIYYTGHGNTKGDWCFPDGTISFDRLYQLGKGAPYIPRVYADCCYSGNWAFNGQKAGWYVICASDSDTKAYNRVFARAVFKKEKYARMELCSSPINAISTLNGSVNCDARVCYINGDTTAEYY